MATPSVNLWVGYALAGTGVHVTECLLVFEMWGLYMCSLQHERGQNSIKSVAPAVHTATLSQTLLLLHSTLLPMVLPSLLYIQPVQQEFHCQLVPHRRYLNTGGKGRIEWDTRHLPFELN